MAIDSPLEILALYEALIKSDEDYVSEFDMDKAVQASCKYVDRVPNIH